jgi:hypothetical protein
MLNFNPETVELTPYFERTVQATVTDTDTQAAADAWRKNPPPLKGENVTLLLEAEAQ